MNIDFSRFNKGYPIKNWSPDKSSAVFSWLKHSFGDGCDKTGEWFVDQDYDFFTLYLTENARLLAVLKFPLWFTTDDNSPNS